MKCKAYLYRNNMNAEYFVYSLNCPITDEVKYIGITTHPNSRLAAHLSGWDTSEKSKWIYELKTEGLKPYMVIIKRGLQYLDAMRLETKTIEHYYKKQIYLVNTLIIPRKGSYLHDYIRTIQPDFTHSGI